MTYFGLLKGCLVKITVEVLENMDHYLTLNNREWSKSNKSEIREIDNVAIDKIINWINKNN
jgi:hypothetical protein